jgi:hypothetical protein
VDHIDIASVRFLISIQRIAFISNQMEKSIGALVSIELYKMSDEANADENIAWH